MQEILTVIFVILFWKFTFRDQVTDQDVGNPTRHLMVLAGKQMDRHYEYSFNKLRELGKYHDI